MFSVDTGTELMTSSEPEVRMFFKFPLQPAIEPT